MLRKQIDLSSADVETPYRESHQKRFSVLTTFFFMNQPINNQNNQVWLKEVAGYSQPSPG